MNSTFEIYDPQYAKQRLLCANTTLDHIGITSLSMSVEGGNEDYVSEIYCWKEKNPM